MVVLSLCFSMLSMRAWDRLIVISAPGNSADAIYACMGQTKNVRLILIKERCYLCVHGTDLWF